MKLSSIIKLFSPVLVAILGGLITVWAGVNDPGCRGHSYFEALSRCMEPWGWIGVVITLIGFLIFFYFLFKKRIKL